MFIFLDRPGNQIVAVHHQDARVAHQEDIPAVREQHVVTAVGVELRRVIGQQLSGPVFQDTQGTARDQPEAVPSVIPFDAHDHAVIQFVPDRIGNSLVPVDHVEAFSVGAQNQPAFKILTERQDGVCRDAVGFAKALHDPAVPDQLHAPGHGDGDRPVFHFIQRTNVVGEHPVVLRVIDERPVRLAAHQAVIAERTKPQVPLAVAFDDTDAGVFQVGVNRLLDELSLAVQDQQPGVGTHIEQLILHPCGVDHAVVQRFGHLIDVRESARADSDQSVSGRGEPEVAFVVGAHGDAGIERRAGQFREIRVFIDEADAAVGTDPQPVVLIQDRVDVQKPGRRYRFKSIRGLGRIPVQDLRTGSADINISLLQRISADCLNRFPDIRAVKIMLDLQVPDHKYVAVVVRAVDHAVPIAAHLVDVALFQALVVNEGDFAVSVQRIDAVVRPEDHVPGRVGTYAADGHDVQPFFFPVIGHLVVLGHTPQKTDVRADPEASVFRNAEADHTVDPGEALEPSAVITHQSAVAARIDKPVRRLCDRHIAQKRQARVDVEDPVIALDFKAQFVPARAAACGRRRARRVQDRQEDDGCGQ